MLRFLAGRSTPALPKGLYNVAVGIVRIVAAAFVFIQGTFKLAGAGWEMEAFRRWGYAPAFMYLIGALEVIGAVLLALPKTRRIGAVELAGLMLGAVYTHLRHGEAWYAPLPAVAVLVACALQFRKKKSM